MSPNAQGEYPFAWKCPKCAIINKDSVHPIYGPFLSVVCSGCGGSFSDGDLCAPSLRSVERARTAAEVGP